VSSCKDLNLSCTELSKLHLESKQCRLLCFRPVDSPTVEHQSPRCTETHEASSNKARNENKRSEFMNNFALSRDWSLISSMWTGLVRSAALPPLIRGYSEGGTYGVTDLNAIHDIGKEEYTSEDPR
jgi:hypothetical protein